MYKKQELTALFDNDGIPALELGFDRQFEIDDELAAELAKLKPAGCIRFSFCQELTGNKADMHRFSEQLAADLQAETDDLRTNRPVCVVLHQKLNRHLLSVRRQNGIITYKLQLAGVDASMRERLERGEAIEVSLQENRVAAPYCPLRINDKIKVDSILPALHPDGTPYGYFIRYAQRPGLLHIRNCSHDLKYALKNKLPIEVYIWEMKPNGKIGVGAYPKETVDSEDRPAAPGEIVEAEVIAHFPWAVLTRLRGRYYILPVENIPDKPNYTALCNRYPLGAVIRARVETNSDPDLRLPAQFKETIRLVPAEETGPDFRPADTNRSAVAEPIAGPEPDENPGRQTHPENRPERPATPGHEEETRIPLPENPASVFEDPLRINDKIRVELTQTATFEDGTPYGFFVRYGRRSGLLHKRNCCHDLSDALQNLSPADVYVWDIKPDGRIGVGAYPKETCAPEDPPVAPDETFEAEVIAHFVRAILTLFRGRYYMLPASNLPDDPTYEDLCNRYPLGSAIRVRLETNPDPALRMYPQFSRTPRVVPAATTASFAAATPPSGPAGTGGTHPDGRPAGPVPETENREPEKQASADTPTVVSVCGRTSTGLTVTAGDRHGLIPYKELAWEILPDIRAAFPDGASVRVLITDPGTDGGIFTASVKALLPEPATAAFRTGDRFRAIVRSVRKSALKAQIGKHTVTVRCPDPDATYAPGQPLDVEIERIDYNQHQLFCRIVSAVPATETVPVSRRYSGIVEEADGEKLTIASDGKRMTVFRPEISWVPVSDPTDFFRPGDPVDFVSLSTETGDLFFSVKRTQANPLAGIEPGQPLAFDVLAADEERLLADAGGLKLVIPRDACLRQAPERLPDVYAPGNRYDGYVAAVDADAGILRLEPKRYRPDPFSALWTGAPFLDAEVREERETDYVLQYENAYIELPRSELDWNGSLCASLSLAPGKKVRVRIVECDAATGRIAATARFGDDPFEALRGPLLPRTVVTGVVTEETSGGLIVVYEGIRIFLPDEETSWLSLDTNTRYRPGETIPLRIVRYSKPGRWLEASGKINPVNPAQTLSLGKKQIVSVKRVDPDGLLVTWDEDMRSFIYMESLYWKRNDRWQDDFRPGDRLTVKLVDFKTNQKKVNQLKLSLKVVKEPHPELPFRNDVTYTARVVCDTQHRLYVEVEGYYGIVNHQEVDWIGRYKLREKYAPGATFPCRLLEADRTKGVLKFSRRMTLPSPALDYEVGQTVTGQVCTLRANAKHAGLIVDGRIYAYLGKKQIEWGKDIDVESRFTPGELVTATVCAVDRQACTLHLSLLEGEPYEPGVKIKNAVVDNIDQKGNIFLKSPEGILLMIPYTDKESRMRLPMKYLGKRYIAKGEKLDVTVESLQKEYALYIVSLR